MSEGSSLQPPIRSLWRSLALCTIVLSLLAAWSIGQALSGYRVDFLRSKWPLLCAGLALAVGLSVWLLIALRNGRPVRAVAWVEGLPGAGFVAKLAALLTLPAGVWLYYLLQEVVFKERIPPLGMLWVYWALALGAGLALKAAFGGATAWMLAVPILAGGVIAKVISFAPDVSSYPLSLGWSEASRYYYASLPFAERLYGQSIPLSILHPTRYLLQSLPFLYPDTPLWAHRLWQVLLWLGTTGITGVLLARRLKLGSRLFAGLLAMWFFLFLFQGAVYYHLQICIWIVLLGTSPARPWRTLLAVLLASAWAGMSRVNWFPVPAMLAAGLYFLESALKPGIAPGLRRPGMTPGGWLWYLLPPAVWFGAGVAVAFLSQALYIYWSGNGGQAAAFASSFTSDLLWYRLWPNPTFAPGVVLGIVLVSLPALALIAQYTATKGRALHGLRWSGLAGMMAVLFGGGLVASVKIGGGGDLHNMDAYLVLLGILAAYLFTDRATAEPGEVVHFVPHYAVALFAVLVPVAFALYGLKPAYHLDYAAADQSIGRVEALAGKVAKGGGEVLFINQRQLLMEGTIKGVPLVPEYELLTLMEMAVSNNQGYLQRFYADLRSHHFAMIIAPAQGSKSELVEQFSDEDNQWVKRVGRYLACTYRVRRSLPAVGLEILVPRKSNLPCR
jgi:hypothetical protein